MSAPDVLSLLAELSIGLSGFSAIVVIFKRRESGGWGRRDADRFHGMILHGMFAALFSILPLLLFTFEAGERFIWAGSSALLGATTLMQTIAAFRLERGARVSRALVGFGGVTVGALLFLNAIGVGFAGMPGPYLVGVSWHVVHTGLLFVLLVWIPNDAIEDA